MNFGWGVGRWDLVRERPEYGDASPEGRSGAVVLCAGPLGPRAVTTVLGSMPDKASIPGAGTKRGRDLNDKVPASYIGLG
jgi:hypothetical protein